MVPGPILDAWNLRRYVEARQKNINLEIQESRRYEEKNIIFFKIRVSHTLVEKKIIGGIIQNHLSPARDNTKILHKSCIFFTKFQNPHQILNQILAKF